MTKLFVMRILWGFIGCPCVLHARIFSSNSPIEPFHAKLSHLPIIVVPHFWIVEIGNLRQIPNPIPVKTLRERTKRTICHAYLLLPRHDGPLGYASGRQRKLYRFSASFSLLRWRGLPNTLRRILRAFKRSLHLSLRSTREITRLRAMSISARGVREERRKSSSVLTKNTISCKSLCFP